MLEKKAEGRPLPPEDYDFMAKFINRVEKRVEEKLREESIEGRRRYEEALATVPELTFEIDILDVDLKEHILIILQEAGIETLGNLVLQMRLDPDRILALNGIGPKSFEEIRELTEVLRVEPEEVVVEEAPAEPIPAEAVETEAEMPEELPQKKPLRLKNCQLWVRNRSKANLPQQRLWKHPKKLKEKRKTPSTSSSPMIQPSMVISSPKNPWSKRKRTMNRNRVRKKTEKAAPCS
jgi:hypothetical protein